MERWRGKGSCLPPGRVCPLAGVGMKPSAQGSAEAHRGLVKGPSTLPRAIPGGGLWGVLRWLRRARTPPPSAPHPHPRAASTSTFTPRPHPRHVRIHAASDIFAARCGVRRRDPLALADVAAYVALDAEPSRKERGRRGVRPCHPNRQTFGSGNRPSGRLGRVPRAARNRVVFVLRPTASIRIRSACQRTESQSSCPRPRSTG